VKSTLLFIPLLCFFNWFFGPLFFVLSFLLWNYLWIVEEVLTFLFFFLVIRMEISRFLWKIYFMLCKSLGTRLCINMGPPFWLSHCTTLIFNFTLHINLYFFHPIYCISKCHETLEDFFQRVFSMYTRLKQLSKPLFML
jgi:hypothetical protein